MTNKTDWVALKVRLTDKNWLAVSEAEGLVEGPGLGQVGKQQEHQEDLHLENEKP